MVFLALWKLEFINTKRSLVKLWKLIKKIFQLYTLSASLYAHIRKL